MKKEEFLAGLQAALSNKVNSSLINENIHYYTEYIDMQTAQGRNEEEVIGELGDPRLLARSITEANKHAGEYENNEEAEEKIPRADSSGRKSHAYRMPGWLFGIVIVLIILAVFSLIFTMLSWLAPILIPLLLIGFVIRMVRSMGR